MPSVNLSSNPSVKHLKKRNQHLINLVMEKVAAHFTDTKKYPLPAAANAPERAVYNLLMAVPKRRREKFIEKAGANITASASKRRQLYDELADADLKSTESMAEQVKKISLPASMAITEDDIVQIKADMTRKAVKPAVRKKISGKPVPQQAAAAIAIRVFADSITCNKKSEIGKEKISLGAAGTDGAGVVQNKEPFFVGKFKKGDNIPLGANNLLFEFPLDSSVGGTFPLTLSTSLFLVEEDWIHNRELSNKLSIACFVIWGACMAATAAIITVGVLGGPATPLMAYLAIAIGMTFLVIGMQLLPLITDDVSEFISDVLVLDAPPAVGDVVNRTVTMRLDNWTGDITIGNYSVALRWEAV